MANTNRRNRKQAENANLKTEAVAKVQASTESPGKLDAQDHSPLRAAIRTTFQNDESVRQAITANLKERSAESKAIAERVRTAFTDFNPSKLSTEDLAQHNYLAPGGDLAKAQRAVIAKGIEAIQSSKVKPSITLHNSSDLKEIIKEKTSEDRSLVGTIELETLINFMILKPDASPPPVYVLCKAELEAQKILKKIEGMPDGEDNSEPTGTNLHHEERSAEQLVKDTVNLQMETAASPESQLRFSVPNRANQGKVQSNLDTFELRAGPSDVTSYHDFYNLQIAFAHVWTKIFDGQLTSLGQELYHEYVKLKEFTGNTAPDPPISTLYDLKKLLEEVKSLTSFTEDAMPGDRKATVDTSPQAKPKTPKDWTEYVKDLTLYNQLANATGNEAVGALLDPAGFLVNAIGNILGEKKQIFWTSFPIAMGQEMINVSFEENVVDLGWVEIVLSAESSQPWKGIDFQELGSAGNVVAHYKISNDPNDLDIWNANSRHVLRLQTEVVKRGVLEFDGETTFRVHHGYYLLARLDEKLKDRTRVTFTWKQ